ncbi:MAG TPA: FAD-dependent monooxygenase [Solirubrobacteraceae bacterium]|jgi:2-polyprenyl-6-methoxyphenol hydroxylase-like FAD-dependent oxidoreductase|nr:FAD-dependent monooxygenase [Solirubrobacteraceae bacterium]
MEPEPGATDPEVAQAPADASPGPIALAPGSRESAGETAGADVGNRVLIIGAGPAGLTAAIALTRIGIEVRVFERAAELGKAGAGLGVQSNALRALQKLGIGDRIEAAGTELRAQEFRNIRGELLFTFPQGEVADEYGTPTISLLRADVQWALIDAVKPGVLQLDSECVAIEQDAQGVTATFADGHTERGALLIGADGGRSVARKHVYGAADTPPRYSGFTSWRAVVEMSPDTLPPDTSRTFLGAGRQFVMFPVGSNRIYWGLLKREPQGGTSPESGLHELLTGYLHDFPEVTRRLVTATEEARVIRADICDRDPERTWIKGRVVLIGDAAHMTTPFIGQGAGISMEDAVVLAKELALTDGLRDQRMLAGALESFQRARMPRCAKIVLTSRRRGRMLSLSNPTVATVRNAALRAVPAAFWHKALASSVKYDL